MIEQFRGCLAGLAVGEAQAVCHSAASTSGMVVSGPAVEQMLCLADSYIAIGGFDPQDVADRLLDWYRSNTAGLDSLTREACENLLYGYHFERAGRDAWDNAAAGGRLSDGSLARAVPTGLVRYHDDIHLVGESRVISGITHHDEYCKLACVCLNLAIAHLLMVGTDGLLDELLEFIGPRHKVLGDALRLIPGLNVPQLRTSGYVVDTLQSALWAVLYCTEFEEGLVLLVNRGEDADTTGAVGGALLGARFGAAAIPERWLNTLAERERIDTLARRLFTLSQELE